MATYCPEDLAARELSCPICFEDYDIHVPHRHPKLLLCLHTFCADCTRLLCRQNGTLECSMCRMVHTGVRVEELFDNHVIFTHLRQKFEERDHELAQRIDKEMREQINASPAPDTVFSPILVPDTVFSPILVPDTVFSPILAPVLTPVLAPVLAPAQATIMAHASPEVVTLDCSMDNTEPEQEEELEEEEGEEEEEEEEEEGEEEEEEEEEDMPFGREEIDWSNDEEQEEEEVETETDENEGEDITAYDNAEVMENDDDEEVDEDDIGQCFLSLRNALEVLRNDGDDSSGDLIDTIDHDNEEVAQVEEEDDEDGWHSASEQCSPEHWNIHLSDGSEELDDGSDIIQWPVLTHEALMED